MLGVSLGGGPGRLLCEPIKMEPGLPWILQDISDASIMRCLMSRAANTEWKQSKRNEYVGVKKKTKPKGI